MDKKNKLLETFKLLEHFNDCSDDFLLMSKLINSYMDSNSIAEENKKGESKRIRRLLDKTSNNDVLKMMGFDSKRKGNKFKYTSFKKIDILDDDDCNTLTDVLSLAEVSKNFHYRNDIPKLKKSLRNSLQFQEEKFEIYVGHNNLGGENSYLKDERKKLNLIKKAINKNDLLKFWIEFDEENDYKNTSLLKSNIGKAFDDAKLSRKINHVLKPYLIIHDSDETFILFKPNDFLETTKGDDDSIVEKNIFVNMANIIFSSMEISPNRKKGRHKIDIEDIKYSFPSRKSIKMKISSSIGYSLKSRQADYSILKIDDTENSWLIEFSEIYHSLNFLFMHGGPITAFGPFYNHIDNVDILKKWNDKIDNIPGVKYESK